MFKINYLFCLLVLSFFNLGFAQEIGFSKGNKFVVHKYIGQVTLVCRDDRGYNRSRSYSCSDYDWNPGIRGIFVHPPVIEGKKVILVATHEDGSTQEKDEKFLGAKGRSKGSFNLGIWTLFQKPLFDMGKNLVEYKILNKEDEVLSQGEFSAEVEYGKRYDCGRATVYDSSSTSCMSASFACARMFQRNANYCREI